MRLGTNSSTPFAHPANGTSWRTLHSVENRLLKLIELIRKPAQPTTTTEPPTAAGSLQPGDVVVTTKRSYRVVSTSFADDARRAGRVVADTVDLVTGRLRVLDFPSADTMVTVKAA
ncbi:hypothetical protein ACFWUP_02520 [Nocardia sp. NPDC058658]|uniref:hypothetical protein n=1 Tax=Nocardia sp. NPDC058658 TaxID=3346580 RepID=UPI00364D4E67